MKKINYLLLLFSLYFGCNSPNEPSGNAADYLPLRSGNKWYYNKTHVSGPQNSSMINMVWETSGQKVINDKKYFIVKAEYLTTTQTDTFYYRLSDNILYSWDQYNGERIIADFSLKLNEKAYWDNELKVVEKSRTKIKYSTLFGADYGHSITFQKGVGITEMIVNGFIYYRTKLIRAEI